MDNDGDKDVLVGGFNIIWYENRGGSFASKKKIDSIGDDVYSIYAADLDNDSDNDVIAAKGSLDSGSIHWYENIDNNNGFSNNNKITDKVIFPQSVHASHLNEDEYIDIIYASQIDDKIAWHENQSGSFSDQKLIPANSRGAQSIVAADLDKDGDQDVISASRDNDRIAWHENKIDNKNEFGRSKIIVPNGPVDIIKSVHIADLNEDGMKDIISSSTFDKNIAWYKNNGGVFSDQKAITYNADGARSVFAADLDGDSDLDVLSASFSDNKIAWYENKTDSFSDQRVITTSAKGATSVYAADIDGDSDPDIISASSVDNTVIWYENDEESFSSQNVVTESAGGAMSIIASDIDGDSDPDIVVAASQDDEVVAYENRVR